ncbi:MAG: hypothetical protein AB7G21_13685, partial [Dehalococcoidia bacterium]
ARRRPAPAYERAAPPVHLVTARYAVRMDAATPGMWGTPVEETLTRYLDTLAAGEAREEVRVLLLTALRAEPIARGCPSLAMITALDLLALRAHLELQATHDVEAVLDATEAFLSWARDAGAHALPAQVVTNSLRPPDV